MTYNKSLVSSKENKLIDAVEKTIYENFDPIIFPLKHTFLKGYYVRTIFMPAGSRLTSQIHRTRHPYRISKGKLRVRNKGKWKHITAPYQGITEPGTRRIIEILEDTVWTSLHEMPWITGKEENFTDSEKLELVAELEKILAEQRVNPLLGKSYSEIKSEIEQKSLNHA